MPSLSALANIPFYGAYTEKKMLNEQQELNDLQRASTLLQLRDRMEQQAQEQAMRSSLAQSGGDVERAMAAAIRSGNLAGAARLAPLLETQRKARQPQANPTRTYQRGTETVTEELTPEGWKPLGSGPKFSPDSSAPEIIKLQRFAATLPEGSPGRQQIEARIARLTQGEGGTDQVFGSGLTGRALAMLTTMAPAYEAGQLTPDQERQFIAAATQYQQPRTYQDPDTGLIQTRRPELPPFVAQALQRRGARLPATDTGGFPRQAGSTQEQIAPQQAPQQAQQADQTAWGLSSLTTGPVPAIGETLGRTPIVGEIVRAPQFTQARNFIPNLQRDLVRVLQNNPRYAEGERRAIEQEININPSVFDTPSAYRDRLVGIDRALQIRERNALETANSNRVGREERIQAMNVVNALHKFRQNLGVPPSIKGDQDWQALPSGSEYIDPEGNVRRKQ